MKKPNLSLVVNKEHVSVYTIGSNEGINNSILLG